MWLAAFKPPAPGMYCVTTVGFPGRCLPICCATRRPHWSLPPPVPGMITVTVLPAYGVSDCAIAGPLMLRPVIAATTAATYGNLLQKCFIDFSLRIGSAAQDLLYQPKLIAISYQPAWTAHSSGARRADRESPRLASRRSNPRRCNRIRL